MSDDEINISRNLLQKASRNKSLIQAKCANCQDTNLMNSHSVSRQFLKRIAVKSKVNCLAKSVGESSNLKYKQTSEVEVAGTFTLFCGTCDKNLFKEYEDNGLESEKAISSLVLKIAWS